MDIITQAVISAGGIGSRLRPLTDIAPKPMVPILGKPLLEWHVKQYKKHGVKNFIFSLGYLPQVVMDYFGDGSRFGVHITYHVETTPLGSFGYMPLLSGLNDRFYFIYGDVFSLVDYSAMSATYASKDAPIGMQRVGRTEERGNADLAELDQKGRFVDIHKKPHTKEFPNAYTLRGSFILERGIISYVEKNMPADLATDVLPRVIADGKNFYGYECTEYSKGIDTMEKIREVETYLQEHHITPWW
jgi:mannose-1-phosphate guanylyltransferase/phosphomannomutase